ncbi:MAG: hypothetical protein ACRC5T_10335 [Cetobacterium sp.]
MKQTSSKNLYVVINESGLYLCRHGVDFYFSNCIDEVETFWSIQKANKRCRAMEILDLYAIPKLIKYTFEIEEII